MRRDEENVKQRIFCLFAAAGRKNEKLREKKICVYMPICLYAYMAFSTHGKDYLR